MSTAGANQTPIVGMPICDGSRFAKVPPPGVVEVITMWGPGRTLIYPWESKNPAYPPVTSAPLNPKPQAKAPMKK
jgi:hypothetical protein